MDRGDPTTDVEPREDKLFDQGHTMCPGCGVAMSVNHVMDVLGEETVVLFSPGCLSAASTIEDNYRFKVPSAHMGLVHSGAFAAGVSAALEQLGRDDVTVAPLAGDGATADIGFQALSAAAERDDDVLYFCHDNEAYANTGVQGSATTPRGAATSTTPAGPRAPYGKQSRKKDLFRLVTDHEVPYAATATPGYLADFRRKVERAKEADGFRFVQVFDPCPEGWKFDSDRTVEVSKLAVQTGMFVLAESRHGEIEVTRKPAERKPVEAYLRLQDRFEHLTDGELAEIQARVDDYYGSYVGGK